ncbi:MAG TPA: hypothetical protein VGM02_01485 [Acidobacteriaceae bacterium]|jgi:hypothetical protein
MTYRPPEWSQPALTVITLTSAPTAASSSTDDLSSGASANTSGASVQLDDGTIATPQFVDNATLGGSASGGSSGSLTYVYVFDAIYRVQHSRRLRMTEHPVQSGASISDHAFILPAKVSLEIGMSDAMDAFTPGVFTSNASKSVSAYETLVSLQTGRQPLTLTTRLDTYTNMLIESIDAPDTKETRYGLKATVVLNQIFTGTVTSQGVSARPQTTDATSIGAKQPVPVSSNASQPFTRTDTTNVFGAGNVSSVGSAGGS